METEAFPFPPPHKTLPRLFQHKHPHTPGEGIPDKCPHKVRLHFSGCLSLLSMACLPSDIILLCAEAGPGDMCGEGSLQDEAPLTQHIPFVCFMAAGNARWSKVQGEVAGKSVSPPLLRRPRFNG